MRGKKGKSEREEETRKKTDKDTFCILSFFFFFFFFARIECSSFLFYTFLFFFFLFSFLFVVFYFSCLFCRLFFFFFCCCLVSRYTQKARLSYEESSSFASSSLRAIRELKILSKEEFFIEKYNKLLEKPYELGVKKAYIVAAGNALHVLKKKLNKSTKTIIKKQLFKKS